MTGASMTPALAATCAIVASAMTDAREPWWIIASAAVALHGVDPGPVGDVDVLLSPRDARRFCDAHALPCRPGGADTRFRSAVFVRWTTPPLPVELMAGFEIATPGGWQAVCPLTRERIETTGGPLHVPGRAELANLLRLFGRPKDLVRAAMLGA